MPDYWETANGLNPNDAEDGKIITNDGYSNLEHYLNSDIPYIDAFEVDTVTTDTPVVINYASQIKFDIYPNPTNDVLYYNSNSKLQDLEIYSLDGKKMKPEYNSCQINSININHFENGFYIVKAIFDENIVIVKSILKQ